MKGLKVNHNLLLSSDKLIMALSVSNINLSSFRNFVEVPDVISNIKMHISSFLCCAALDVLCIQFIYLGALNVISFIYLLCDQTIKIYEINWYIPE